MRFEFSLLLALLASLGLSAGESSARKPNVILIMADDVSWECFGSYGAQDYQTPHIDRMAKDGLRFSHCYSTPLCTPSRVKIMTGKYNFRNYTHFGYLDPKEKTFGQMMQKAGYKTAIAGKWQLNGLYHKAKGCHDATRPNKAGFDEYCLWQLTKQKSAGERFWSPVLEHNGKLLSAKENAGKFGPDIMSDFVCDFIERNKDRPFFVYYPTVLVHAPFVPTPDTIGNGPRSQVANRPNKKDAKKNFVAMVNYLDKVVGKIVKKVESVGQIENTIIVFTADNGTNTKISSQWNGKTIKGGKGSTTDMGTHVPLVIYWKGHTPKGVVLNDLIDFTDFYPTLRDAAGMKPTKDDPIDGRSFFPQLNGEKGNPRDWVLCHYQPYWGGFPGRQFVRTDLFKLYRSGQFYHVPADLQEQKDLPEGKAGQEGEADRQLLKKVIQYMPPAPPQKGGKSATTRPTHPDWKNVVDPN